MLHLEIQCSMMPMHEQKYSKEHGGTAECTLCLIEATQYSGSNKPQRQKERNEKKRELFYGDSWFTSWHLCTAAKERFGHEYFGALKTNHSGTSKEEMD